MTNNTDFFALSGEDVLENLKDIQKKQVGLIELDAGLDVETVTEIFIRINSKGVVLSQADFVMSKIAANEKYGGNTLRKSVDYFCHMARAPEFYTLIKESADDFVGTDYFKKMSWLKDENDDLYDPSYSDMLRVAYTFKFGRGKLADLVSLLSGRNFETREYEEPIEEHSYELLKDGVLQFMNETNFKRFLMIIRSAGFVDNKLIRSQNTLNFAYILYLKLREQNVNPAEIEGYVKRWFVMSILTGRYSGSPESWFDYDIKRISKGSFVEYLSEIEAAELSEGFWTAGLIQSLNTSSSSNRSFLVYLAAQTKLNDRGFLSKDITVKNMLEHRGDIHHVFPRNYLKKLSYTQSMYNQVANYVYMQQETNIKVGDDSPKKYMKVVLDQCISKDPVYGGIVDREELTQNLIDNALPENLPDMEVSEFQEFLVFRRQKMAEKIKQYYLGL